MNKPDVTTEEMLKLTDSDIQVLKAVIPLQDTEDEREVQARNKRRVVVYEAIRSLVSDRPDGTGEERVEGDGLYAAYYKDGKLKSLVFSVHFWDLPDDRFAIEFYEVMKHLKPTPAPQGEPTPGASELLKKITKEA